MSRLETELAEQPDVVAGLLDVWLPRVGELRAALREGRVDRVLLVARGSSDNAGRYAQYLWPTLAGVDVRLATPSLHTVYDVDRADDAAPPRGRDRSGEAVVAVSQSGQSPDVLAVVRAARAGGAFSVALTNDPASPLAESAERVLDLGAGPERSVAATKTYTASLAAVAVLGCALADRDRGDRAAAELATVPESMRAAIAGASGVDEVAGLLARHDRAVCVGRGWNTCTAHETALKVTELTGRLVAPYSPADLMHGPVAAVGPDVPVLAVVPDEPASASVRTVLPELRRRGAPVVLLGDPAADDPPGPAVRLPGPQPPGWLTPFTQVLAGQLVAWRTAELLGVDVDRPGELSKVTRTH